MTNAYINNDHTLSVTGLVDTQGNTLDSASITYQIYDADDEAVSGASGTLTQDGTSGDYAAEVDQSIIDLLTEGGEYTIRVSGSDGGYDFEWDIPIRCVRRIVG